MNCKHKKLHILTMVENILFMADDIILKFSQTKSDLKWDNLLILYPPLGQNQPQHQQL